MDPASLLMGTAQLALALAGFSGVVMALRLPYRDPVAMPYARLWRLVESSLAAAGFSLLPIVLLELRVEPGATWRSCSALLATYVWVSLAYFMLRFRAVWTATTAHWRFNGPAIGFGACAVVAVYANASGAFPGREFGVYYAAVSAYLGFAALVFARLLLQGSRDSEG